MLSAFRKKTISFSWKHDLHLNACVPHRAEPCEIQVFWEDPDHLLSHVCCLNSVRKGRSAPDYADAFHLFRMCLAGIVSIALGGPGCSISESLCERRASCLQHTLSTPTAHLCNPFTDPVSQSILLLHRVVVQWWRLLDCTLNSFICLTSVDRKSCLDSETAVMSVT